MKKILGIFASRSLAAFLLVPVLIAGCGRDLAEPLQSGRVLSWDGLQGRWVGAVTPADANCGGTTHGTMSVGPKDFGFDPFQSTVVIHGQVGDDGHLSGDLVRPGGDHQPVEISFVAAATGPDSIRGTLQSGRCHWTVTLERG